MLKHIRILLCQTSHPGNIGAASRAMKNMGLDHLTLIAPERFPDPEAFDRAAGAADLLHRAQIVETLEEALSDCHWVFGTSTRQRTFSWPQLTPKQAAQKMIAFSKAHQQVAIIFGPERAGLTNEQLQQCDFHISIPTHPGYPSLNLAQAVQVITYEIYQSWLKEDEIPAEILNEPILDKANALEVSRLLTHFEEVSLACGFLDPQNPKSLVPRLKRLFAKAQLEKDEINMLHGLLKALQTD